MTHPPPTAQREQRNDRKILHRSQAKIALVLSLATCIAFAVPVSTTLAAGEQPYDRVHVGFPGMGIGIATTATQVLADIAAVVTIGCLITLLFLRADGRNVSRRMSQSVEFVVLRASSATWSFAAACMVALELFDSNGASPALLTEALTDEARLDQGLTAISFLFDASQHAQAWAITFVVASVVATLSVFAERWTTFLFALWASFIGLLGPVVVGQILVGPNHDFGSDAGAVQTVAIAVTLGVVSVSAIRVASGRFLRIETAQRLFRLTCAGVSLAVITDPVLAVFKLQGQTALQSQTAAQILARSVGLIAIVAVIAAAAVQWRRGSLTDRRIARLVAVGALATAWWMGWSVAMTRIPPPQYFVPTSIVQNFLGFDLFDAPSLEVVATHWRPNLLFAALGVAGVAIYLGAVRVLHRRGDRWPVGRTVAWVLGWTVAVVATSSALGKYSGADFGIHMIVHMALNMLAPLLLVLGGFVTLLLRATSGAGTSLAGVHEWLSTVLKWRLLHFFYHPLLVFVLFVGSYYALYFTGLFEELVRYHWGHQLMNLHFLLVGYMYYSLAVGVDRPPRPLPHVGKLGFVLAAMPFHAFFGVILMTSSVLVAENFYMYLRLPWLDLADAQYMAGGVAWAAGEIPLMIVVVALGIQWARQDARQGVRIDRHLDSGLDDEFDEYNRMLARLTDREATLTPRPKEGEHS